jgi:hypothetical protein
MDIDALAEKYDWQGFETYFYLFGALGTFSLGARRTASRHSVS